MQNAHNNNTVHNTATNATVVKRKVYKSSTSCKTYTAGGYSTLNNTRRLRLTNNASARIAMLQQLGDTDIHIVQFNAALTRKEAIAYLAAHNVY